MEKRLWFYYAISAIAVVSLVGTVGLFLVLFSLIGIAYARLRAKDVDKFLSFGCWLNLAPLSFMLILLVVGSIV